ncbi:MAG: Lrp/AsnC family leucine-responsive transcriptional regulator [Lentimonas sp.]|jgi:Lrp/AsnC family leucine-responsive transcriptional regulator
MDSIDDIDKKILTELQRDSRITNKELSEILGMSTSPVFERVKKLEKSGFIKDYVALLDRKKLGKNLMAMIAVSLSQHNKKLITSFIDKVSCLPEVLEAYHTTGRSDFLLKVIIADMDEYQDFVLNKLSTIAEVSQMETSFVMSEIKNSTAININ